MYGLLNRPHARRYMKYDAPLFLQSIMPLKAVFDNSEHLGTV